MQGKPPPNQAAQGPQSSPGATPPPPPSVLPSDAGAESAGLRGKAPPAGADVKPRGRGGSGAQLSDVRWGMIFKMGWQLMGFFKVLVVSYAIVTLLQNCVTLGSSQLLGEVTNAIKGRGGPPTEVSESAQPRTNPAASAPANATTPAQRPAPEEPRKNPLVLLVLWATFALIALGVRLPLRAVATKLDLAMSNKLRSQLFA